MVSHFACLGNNCLVPPCGDAPPGGLPVVHCVCRRRAWGKLRGAGGPGARCCGGGVRRRPSSPHTCPLPGPPPRCAASPLMPPAPRPPCAGWSGWFVGVGRWCCWRGFPLPPSPLAFRPPPPSPEGAVGGGRRRPVGAVGRGLCRPCFGGGAREKVGLGVLWGFCRRAHPLRLGWPSFLVVLWGLGRGCSPLGGLVVLWGFVVGRPPQPQGCRSFMACLGWRASGAGRGW